MTFNNFALEKKKKKKKRWFYENQTKQIGEITESQRKKVYQHFYTHETASETVFIYFVAIGLVLKNVNKVEI